MTWQEQSERFRFVPVLSNPDADWTGQIGFVHEAVLRDYPDLSGFEVYACGNPSMVEAARVSFTDGNMLAKEDFISDAFMAAAILTTSTTNAA